ncbi:hypothetical protein EVG20_g11636, partial [Dentipellis fragilis]
MATRAVLKCLQVHDILLEIMEYVGPRGQLSDIGWDVDKAEITARKAVRRDLLAIALTSKLVLNDSLEFLWSDLDSLAPVFALLGLPRLLMNPDGNYGTGLSSLPSILVHHGPDCRGMLFSSRLGSRVESDSTRPAFDVSYTIQPETVAHLSQFPMLRTLNVNIAVRFLASHLPEAANSNLPLPKIEFLWLRYPTLQSCTEFLKALKAQRPLRMLNAGYKTALTPAPDLAAYTAAVAEICIPQS